jgi:UDP-N-acetylglucosamine 1-carboxyvinyltransferase
VTEFLVEGGRPISGTIVPAGNKNEALPVIAAAVAAQGPVTLENVPRIGDVHRQLAIVERLGARVEWRDEHTVVIDPGGGGAARPRPPPSVSWAPTSTRSRATCDASGGTCCGGRGRR